MDKGYEGTWKYYSNLIRLYRNFLRILDEIYYLYNMDYVKRIFDENVTYCIVNIRSRKH